LTDSLVAMYIVIVIGSISKLHSIYHNWVLIAATCTLYCYILLSCH